MKNIILATVLFVPGLSLAQENSSETVEVTGSRIPNTVFGPVLTAGGSPIGPTYGCAEPNCGEAPEDPTGVPAVTQKQKNADNKKAREKAKQQKDKLAENMRQDKSRLERVLEWIKGQSIKLDGESRLFFRVKSGNTEIEAGGCLKYNAELNAKTPGANAGQCVERRMDSIPVVNAKGFLENQLEISYVIYDTCYWEKTCRPEYISFIAGSEAELKSFINDTVGEIVI